MSKLHEYLEQYGIENWSLAQGSKGISGIARLKTFEKPFELLSGQTIFEGIYFEHKMYTDWGWIFKFKEADKILFQAMDDELIDDCIYEIMRHLNVLDLIHFAQYNDRCMKLAKSKLSRLQITLATVGTIGMINFRYLINLLGESITELSISLKVFPSVFGFYYDETKEDALRTICNLIKPQLKRVYFYDFNFNKSQNEILHYLRSLSQRGTEIIEVNE